MNKASDNWRKRAERWHQVEKDEFTYCRFRGLCDRGAQELLPALKTQGLFYKVCHSPFGCPEKSFYPQRIDVREKNK